MVADDRPDGVPPDGAYGGRYYGPYDEQRSWPSFEAPSTSFRSFPAPTGVPVLQPRDLETVAPPPGRGHRDGDASPGRGARVVVLATALAVVAGGAAGFGGAYVAGRTVATQPPPTTSSTPLPPSTDPSTGATTSPAPTTEPPRTTGGGPAERDAVTVARVALPSTVMIRVGRASNGVIGSGFVIDAKGLIMTNSHVVAKAADGAPMTVVFSDGSRATAGLVGRTASYDLAVIRVKPPRPLTAMRIGDSDAVQVGQRVVAIGAPLGLQGTVTEGIISATARPVAVGDSSANSYMSGLQTDAPINPGNSGGPLLDSSARVIGVNSAILTLTENRTEAGNIGLGFAIPINDAMKLGRLLIKNGKLSYPLIGASVEDTEDFNGVKITKLVAGGPAQQAGLRVGDVLLTLDGERIEGSDDLVVRIRSHRPGEKVVVKYRRGRSTPAPLTIKLDGKEG